MLSRPFRSDANAIVRPSGDSRILSRYADLRMDTSRRRPDFETKNNLTSGALADRPWLSIVATSSSSPCSDQPSKRKAEVLSRIDTGLFDFRSASRMLQIDFPPVALRFAIAT